ncbi:MAG: hypothetical protein U0Q55_07610 [Vicinamibacterales bacterium]
MITEFERRLAEVLGARLPAPFAGRVSQAPGSGDANPEVLVGVRRFDRIDEGFHERPELVPGATDPRRIARLRCEVALTVRGVADRGDALRGVDAVSYAVDAPDLRDGSVLRPSGGDPGFLIDSLLLSSGVVADDKAGASTILVTAQGWFWPVGLPGQAGTIIGEVRVRGIALPLELTPTTPLAAGGPAATLTLHVNTAGLLRLGGVTPLPFGQLVVQVFAPGRKPGAGALGGGTAGKVGSRLLSLVDGAATLTYQPPATPAIDQLVVSLDDGSGGAGVELGRFAIVVKA